jgi:hypothetical protein
MGRSQGCRVYRGDRIRGGKHSIGRRKHRGRAFTLYSSHGCKHVRVPGTASRDKHTCTKTTPAAQVSRLGENGKSQCQQESRCVLLLVISSSCHLHSVYIIASYVVVTLPLLPMAFRHSHSQAPSALTSDVYCKNLPACTLSAHSSTAFGSTHHSHERAQSARLAASHHLPRISTCVQLFVSGADSPQRPGSSASTS